MGESQTGPGTWRRIHRWIRLRPGARPLPGNGFQIIDPERDTDMTMTEPFEQTAHAIEERVRPQVERATQNLTRLNRQVTTYIKANPGRCLLGAVAAGYVIGRIARRK
jgi:hypothetical protein